MCIPRLMPHFQLRASVVEPGHHRRQHLVDGLGAEATPQHQQPQGALPGVVVRPRGSGLHQLAAHGIPQHHTVLAFGKSAGKRRHHLGGQRCQHPVGGAGNGVLLVNQQRFAQQPRCHAGRTRHIAAHAHHTTGCPAVYQPQCLHCRQRQVTQAQQFMHNRLAANTAYRQAMQGDSGSGYDTVFQAATGTDPLHPVAACQQLVGDSQSRIHVPPRAAGRHQYQRARRRTHARLPGWRASRSMRNTIASIQQQMIRLVPP